MRRILFLTAYLGCSSPSAVPAGGGQPPPPAPAPAGDPAQPIPGDTSPGAGTGFAQPPPGDGAAASNDAPVAAGQGESTAGLHYLSDCSLTHPIARDPCSGTQASDRGLASCASLNVRSGQTCTTSSRSCYLARVCPDGHQVVADYLICADKAPSRCLTRSSRRYKDDVRYLSPAERSDVARQIETLSLATFRYKDQLGGLPRLGFLTEDVPSAPFVSEDGRTVDLYALLAASIAAIQEQDARIRALERQVSQCRSHPNPP